MEDEKQVLIKQQQDGDALREMQNHQGWKVQTKILSDMYGDAVIRLIEKDDADVRALIKAIENLADQIQLKIDFGKSAAEQLKSAKFINMQATS